LPRKEAVQSNEPNRPPAEIVVNDCRANEGRKQQGNGCADEEQSPYGRGAAEVKTAAPQEYGRSNGEDAEFHEISEREFGDLRQSLRWRVGLGPNPAERADVKPQRKSRCSPAHGHIDQLRHEEDQSEEPAEG
jgi:hypothetical protein